tara:strand:- start:138 stop:605 length:468 start_codon:yes stop_codon:yes gene_type:complete
MMTIDARINSLVLNKILKEDADKKVIELLAGSLNRRQVEYLAKVMTEENFEFLTEGCYFKTPWNEKEFGGSTSLDDLYDMGLYRDGNIYGQIQTSDDWGTDFDPYYYKMKCSLFLHDDNKKLIQMDQTISSCKLTKINKKDIKHFNYGTDITKAT